MKVWRCTVPYDIVCLHVYPFVRLSFYPLPLSLSLSLPLSFSPFSLPFSSSLTYLSLSLSLSLSPRLKSLLQLMAASHAGRDVVYFTFGDRIFQRDLCTLLRQLVQNKISVGQVSATPTNHTHYSASCSLFFFRLLSPLSLSLSFFSNANYIMLNISALRALTIIVYVLHVCMCFTVSKHVVEVCVRC